jgi:hypothetical protein
LPDKVAASVGVVVNRINPNIMPNNLMP